MQNKHYEIVPLGFSDLNPDEVMLVSIFRTWYQQKQQQQEIENSIRILLENDVIYPALTEIFNFFRRFVYLRLVHINDNELLSPTEEHLLKVLSCTKEYQSSESKLCREKLLSINIVSRPMESIDRSGVDFLNHKVAQSYLNFLNFPL